MRFFYFLGCLAVTFTFLGSAHAQPYVPTHLLPGSAGSGPTCLHVGDCGTSTTCGLTTCATATNGMGTVSGPLCTDPAADIYCCNPSADGNDCPRFGSGGTAPVCITVTSVSGVTGICNYGLNWCIDASSGGRGPIGLPGVMAIEACYDSPTISLCGSTPPPAGRTTYALGDCDGDGVVNSLDPAVCLPMSSVCDAGVADAGPSDAGVTVSPDLGTITMPDLGAVGDGGGSNVDLGNIGPTDLGTAPVDSGGSSLDGAAPGTDLGGGVDYRGSGGCNCAVAAPAGVPGGVLVGLVALGLPLARRLRRRSR